ncbi:SGNH/GDSL hydrolase family protein [Dyadobacter flavalbus]|uniref:SGNH/GDSL hydrolase family protein n=1 Tax=Dyadobacter flavalbus TaxID=2579942 RepID=A0A5M8Q9Q1_9BACT|nr:SGNH/GDSL hydrolase family protein [Dyadobacter flavalbus]KAA6431580.1 SGNH/GDSL hydrolase family protein [Dyadobacter flavalbus]
MKKFLLFFALLLLMAGAGPRKISWVAIGDSITYLNDHQNETGNRITKGYMTLISEKYPFVSYINQGHNGWTSVNIADKINELGLVKADVYTVFLGTNDWWQGKKLGTISDYEQQTGTGTVYGSFRVITDKLKKLNKKASVILITPMQRGDFVYINGAKNNAYGSYKPKNGQTLEQFANAIMEIGKFEKYPVLDLYHESGITLENMVHFKRLKDPASGGPASGGPAPGEYTNYTYPEYTNIPFDPEKDEYPYPPEAVNMTYDGLHPSDKGYAIIAEKLAEKWKGLK